jgi:hypothetical protein
MTGHFLKLRAVGEKELLTLFRGQPVKIVEDDQELIRLVRVT